MSDLATARAAREAARLHFGPRAQIDISVVGTNDFGLTVSSTELDKAGPFTTDVPLRLVALERAPRPLKAVKSSAKGAAEATAATASTK